ncbi:MAG TPA: hypothetical protein VFK94_03950 [Patescibacteria group bacterium]|nr:hypothetical protein [Patescibacteria group bacterium]
MGVDAGPKAVAYLSIDPGEKYNGWATFDCNGDLITMGTVYGINEMTDFLEQFPTDALRQVIVEDYRIGVVKGKYGAAHQQGSRALTIKTIGMIESWTYRKKLAPIVLQANSIKPTGYMWAGITVPKNKDLSHETDAYVHGVYFLQKSGVRRPQQAKR